MNHPDSEYATDLYVIAGCNANPEEHLVTRVTRPCRSAATSRSFRGRNDDGDTYEVAAPFSWSVDDPVGFNLEFPLGETNNLIRPFVVGPPLTESGQERTTILHACATNDCPTPIPDDCVETLCVDLPLVAVARIGGTWIITSSQHNGTRYTSLKMAVRSRARLEPMWKMDLFRMYLSHLRAVTINSMARFRAMDSPCLEPSRS
jgi:hypothetical protein